jgi:hypothetical protein
MTDLVSPEEIEGIVGTARHPTEHWGRAVSTEQTVYILHSQECRDSGRDLRACPFSLALDDGIDVAQWAGREDQPVRLAIVGDEAWLVPTDGESA